MYPMGGEVSTKQEKNPKGVQNLKISNYISKLLNV